MRLGLLYQAWRNLSSKPLQSTLTVILLMFGVSMISLFLLMKWQLKATYDKNRAGVDMVLGAKGSSMQLIMSSIYHIDDPVGNISYKDAKRLLQYVYYESIPISLGDNHEGYRIVGTEHSYVDLYQASVQHGELWNDTIPFGATIGSKVAKNLGLNVGDTFYSAHGLKDQSVVHEDRAFTVVGILNPSETVLDQLILTSLKSIWDIHKEEGEELTLKIKKSPRCL